MLDKWLSPEVLEWQALNAGSGTFPPTDLRVRSYHMLTHAERLLEQSPSELLLADVITNLRRAIDRRVTALKRIYSLKSIPFDDKPADSLGLLESLGIIRSHMLRKLIDIRNAVEHQDAAPPDQGTCKVFAEFTWYFLKSTDRMLEDVPDSFYFWPSNNMDEYELVVEYGPNNHWTPRIGGWLKAEMLSDVLVTEWIFLKVEQSETRDTVARPWFLDPVGKPNDIRIDAEVRGPASALARITQAYSQ